MYRNSFAGLVYFFRFKKKMNFFLSNLKKIQVQLMSFYYINVETEKLKNVFFFESEKNKSPANEFLLHKCRNENDFFFQI